MMHIAKLPRFDLRRFNIEVSRFEIVMPVMLEA